MTAEAAAFVCSHVFQHERPVLLVVRAEGDWQLLCGDGHDEGETPRVVGLNHFLDSDPSLRALLDLPPEWEAKRAAQGGAWERRPIT